MNTRAPRGAFTVGELPSVAWHISTRSENGGGSCVEAGRMEDGSVRVAVRHSHHPNGPAFVYSRNEWNAFIGAAKNGQFDFG